MQAQASAREARCARDSLRPVGNAETLRADTRRGNSSVDATEGTKAYEQGLALQLAVDVTLWSNIVDAEAPHLA